MNTLNEEISVNPVNNNTPPTPPAHTSQPPQPSQNNQSQDHTMEKQAEIWALGGGKGGTGKTFVIIQMAHQLANKGKRVILVDADFGGANVHSFFGIRKPEKNIMSFFDKKTPLAELVEPTTVPNLQIIAGNYQAVSSGNLNYAQKTKLLSHIRKLDADYVLLDLGAGTGNDTVDAFILADKMIMVTIPEITAIENLFQFAKNVFYRKITQIPNSQRLKKRLKEVWKEHNDLNIHSIATLVDFVKKESPEFDGLLSEALKDFSISVILNMVRNAMEIQEGFSIRSICIKHIGIDTKYAGYVEYDFQFWKNLSLIQTQPRLNISYRVKKDIMTISDNIINGKQMKISSIKNV